MPELDEGAVLYADRVTTVSPSYAHEIMTAEFGKGLDQILRMESGKVSGIVNGIDTDLFNPETDPLWQFSLSNDLSGKAKNKRAFRNVSVYLFAMMFLWLGSSLV